MTIDELARMVAKGFESTATKQDLEVLRSEFKKGMKNIDERLEDIDHRLGGIEHNHTRRIENLEDKIRIITTVFEKNLKIKLPK